MKVRPIEWKYEEIRNYIPVLSYNNLMAYDYGFSSGGYDVTIKLRVSSSEEMTELVRILSTKEDCIFFTD
jgi:hypothetical protein